jgi:hypothetical protein|tara:strand:+ start:1350 stop:1997 length:648 start_codon:yes stop_codon:yes gene_type:complete
MSNYTKSTNFATKDNLAAGNALKRVKGAEIDDEFNALSVAIATKANSNNTALTGVPVAPTAASGTNSIQIATTAFTASAIAAIPAVTAALINGLSYPVGSIYTAVVSTNPATLLGVGSWSAFGAGRVLLGNGGGYSAGTTGGATTDSHTLTTSEIPSHTHASGWTLGGGDGSANVYATTNGGGGAPASGAAGGGAAHTHDIVQPYIVVYMWKRTA